MTASRPSEYEIDIMEHISKVKEYMNIFINLYESDLCTEDLITLMLLSETHDFSKLYENDEKQGYIKLCSDLKNVTYGTPEYFDIINSNNCNQLHYKNNKHHPEHFDNGVEDMSPIQLTEMVADWMAANYRKNKSFSKFQGFIESHKERFKISDDLFERLVNTYISILKNKRVLPNAFEYIK